MTERSAVSADERGADERGAATVVGLLLAVLVVFVAYAVSAVTGLVATHRQAQAAADLAALAGASALQDGAEPCLAARGIAAANRARMQGCQVDDWNVVVEVVARSAPILGTRHELPARGRAGPVAR